jgi:aquaporin NIP
MTPTGLRQKVLAECFGTFTLLFAGTGAIVINDTHGGVTHVGIALTFGLMVLALIYALGDVSGAHLNPAVTIAFTVAGRFPAASVMPYLLSQGVGAFTASVLLRVLFPDHATLGSTLPAREPWRAFILELILTTILMVVILRVSIGAKEKGITAGIAVGSVIGLEALFAGPACGASMNPIRSLAPAVVSGQVQYLWVYLLAPTVGALLGIVVAKLLEEPKPQQQEPA